MSLIGIIAKEFAIHALGKAVSDGETFSKIQNIAGITSLSTAFAAAVGAVAPFAASALGASAMTTVMVGSLGATLGMTLLPLVVTAGVLWAGMALLQASGLRETLGSAIGGKSLAPALSAA